MSIGPLRFGRSLGLGAVAFALVVGSVATLAHFRGVPRARAAGAEGSVEDPLAMKVVQVPNAAKALAPPFAGLDLSRIALGDNGATAALPNKRVAELTIDPRLQRAAIAAMKTHKLPEATIVMMDPDTGAILAYASRLGNDHARDLAIEATAPSASVFKIVTAAALVEKDGANAQTRECFARSAEQRVVASDLVVDPLRDKWCMTLATAMGKSENAVFARMAHDHLDQASLETAARALGYGAPIAFDVAVQPSKLEVPKNEGADALGFARTAAGFWNTTLSPLHAAEIAATVARNGEAIRPHVVARVTDDAGHVEYEARDPETRRAISPAAAEALTTMMEHTITEGTSYRAFHDARRAPFVPVSVAGKTGTLSGAGLPEREGASKGSEPRLYSWFTGFAPSHAEPGKKRVAIAVLVVNKPRWHVKANVVAREMLREFFREDAPRVASR